MNQILSLLELKDWCNYWDGSAINEEAVLIALSIAEVLPNHIYKNIQAFLLNDGNITLKITLQRNLNICLLINSEENIVAYIEDKKNIQDLGVYKFENIKKFIRQQYSSLDE